MLMRRKNQKLISIPKKEASDILHQNYKTNKKTFAQVQRRNYQSFTVMVFLARPYSSHRTDWQTRVQQQGPLIIMRLIST